MLSADKKTRIAVLVSGGGTNLQALIDAQKSGLLHSGEIVLVVSSNPDAYALKRAMRENIAAAAVSKKALGGQEAFEQEILRLLKGCDAELIILAGFMSILSADFTSEYDGRIINIHPSLIPSFCGKGAYGIHVHEMALNYGVKVTGATVHYVNEIPDGGKIILQKAVCVLNGDTPEALQKRVMTEAEQVILPEAAELISAKLLECKRS